MKAFLDELAETLYASTPDLSALTVVFPNRRASLYFRKHLAARTTKPMFAPDVLTFEDWISSFTPVAVPDKLDLVYRLHQSYSAVMPGETESFDQFFPWGEMLLRDFDELDRYLVDARLLFTDLSHLKELEDGLTYLSDTQKEYLRNFWSVFANEQSPQQEKFIRVWRQLYPLYTHLNEQLAAEGIAYEGRVHRLVAQQCLDNTLTIPPKRQWCFAGFNALTRAELTIISYFVERGVARIEWDSDQYYLNNSPQEAGRFMNEYLQHPVLGKTFPALAPDNLRSAKDIRIYSAAQPMGQVKLMAKELADALAAGCAPEDTVIILPDEKWLMPVLYSIAPVAEKFNVTMGFPLTGTPAFNLIELLIDLQRQSSSTNFSFRVTQPVLSHPYVMAAGAALAQAKLKHINQHNWVSIPAAYLVTDTLLHARIFQRTETLPEYLIDALTEVSIIPGLDDLDREYVRRTIQLLNRLSTVWENVRPTSRDEQMKSFLRLFRQFARSEKIPFTGEPLIGIQVMGVLESRNLDFKTVFMLALNEGLFPAGKRSGSYIPFSLRKAYNMPTDEHDGAIYGYLFYRALQRAQNVHLFYNSEPDVLGQGEMSRYLQQLIYESGLPLKHVVLHNSVQARPVAPIQVSKDEAVLRAIEKLNEGNRRSRGFAPSALNTYLDCRLKFYYQYVARIREMNSVQEEIDPRVLGNLLHYVMEHFYRRIIDTTGRRQIERADLENAAAEIDRLIDAAFIDTYHLSEDESVVYEGQRVVVREVVRRFAARILEEDKTYAPFTIEALEQNAWSVSLPIAFGPGQAILGGTIDRVDFKDDCVRVIDYKTGRDKLDLKDLPSLIDRDGKRNKAAFQTLVYALLYRRHGSHNKFRIQPGLFGRDNLFDQRFQFGLIQDGELVNDAHPLLDEFESLLQELLNEIFNPAIPFDQTSKEETCRLCAYRNICRR